MRYESYSSLTQHRECPQKWAYGRLDRFEPISQSETIARDFGTWGHAWLAIDAMRRGVRQNSLRYTPETVQLGNGKHLVVGETTVPGMNRLEKEMWTALTYWWHSLSEEESEAWVDYLGQPAPIRLAEITKGYRKRWQESDRQNRLVVAVELPWERELTEDVTLRGMVDLVEMDVRRSVLVVTDHKFKKSTEQSSEEDMFDSQLQLYAWGCAPTVEGWGLGPVKAVAYDRIRSVAPKTPTLTATGTLSKSVTDYDLATYLRWAAGPDGDGVAWGTEGEFVKTGKNAGKPKFGTYTADPAVIEKLSSKAEMARWFDRSFSPISSNIVRTHLLSAEATAGLIPATIERHDEEGDAPRNFTFGCKFCDFRRLCAAQLIGGPRGGYPLDEFGLRQKPSRNPV